MTRTNVYVDGFNLYHGLKEMIARSQDDTGWRWLDIRQLAQRLAPRDDVRQIRYFTARVAAGPHDPGLELRQEVFIRALESLPGLSVHYGQFMQQKKRMPLAAPIGGLRRRICNAMGMQIKVHPDGNASVKVWRTEEKGSDVNLAAHLLADAFRGQFDKAIVISNDTDLCEPIRMVVRDLGLPVIVVNPRGHRRPAEALRKVATETRGLREAVVRSCQFPATFVDMHGSVTKPESW